MVEGWSKFIGGRVRLPDGGWHSIDRGWRLTDTGWPMTNRCYAPLALCEGSSVPEAGAFFSLQECYKRAKGTRRYPQSRRGGE